MGEYAEMMLDGTCCECCGTFMGDGPGFTRYCSRQCAEGRGATWVPGKPKSQKAVQKRLLSDQQARSATLGKKRRKWLGAAAHVAGPGELYDGVLPEHAPGVLRDLERIGFVRLQYPHNPIHKPRYVATEAGVAKLSEGGGQ